MNGSYKKELICLIGELEKDIGKETIKKLFDSGDNSKGDKVGCNQFREIASDCRAADCYEELVLLIRYTEAKSKNNAAWKTVCENGETFGENIVHYMEKVRDLGTENDRENVQMRLQLFFGYLYMQSRVWADKE